MKAKPILQGHPVSIVPGRRSRDHFFGAETSGPAADDRGDDDARFRNEAAAAARAAPEQRNDGRGRDVAEPPELESRATERQVGSCLMATTIDQYRHGHVVDTFNLMVYY